jgi:hypothetical protein
MPFSYLPPLLTCFFLGLARWLDKRSAARLPLLLSDDQFVVVRTGVLPRPRHQQERLPRTEGIRLDKAGGDGLSHGLRALRGLSGARFPGPFARVGWPTASGPPASCEHVEPPASGRTPAQESFYPGLAVSSGWPATR